MPLRLLSVLLVEPDEGLREVIAENLTQAHCALAVARGVDEALAVDAAYDLILLSGHPATKHRLPADVAALRSLLTPQGQLFLLGMEETVEAPAGISGVLRMPIKLAELFKLVASARVSRGDSEG